MSTACSLSASTERATPARGGHPELHLDVGPPDRSSTCKAATKWVVGTRRIRRVDVSWPEVGSKFHHAIGTSDHQHD